MTELIAVILSVGALLPLLTAVLQQPSWSDKTRTVAGIGVSALAGLVSYVSVNGLDFSTPSAIVASVVGVIIAAAASYRTIWKPSGVAPIIEAKTSKNAVVRKEISTKDSAVSLNGNNLDH